MSAAQFKAVLMEWEMSQAAFADWLGVSLKTSQRFANNGVHWPWLVKIIRYMLKVKLTPNIIDKKLE